MTKHAKITPFRTQAKSRSTFRLGFVSLVGAGAGPIEQLTLGAVNALKDADIVLYDALVSDAVLGLIRKSAKAIYTGKRCGRHALSQEQINALLVSYGLQGLKVVRLKAGDPFIFGRGGEEVEALRAAGLDYRIVPGVSALNGVAANFALPLTTRHLSAEFRAIQGHRLPQDDTYWRDLARYNGTVIIFMGAEKWHSIAARLLNAGKDSLTPFAIIETSESGKQYVHRGTLATAAAARFDRRSDGPAIIYLGANVTLMDDGLPLQSASVTSDNLIAGRA